MDRFTFSFFSSLFSILLEFSRQTKFQLSELWNISRFQCWNILNTPWPIWDSVKPKCNGIRIMGLGSKINTLAVSQIKKIESNQIKTTVESNQIKNRESNRVKNGDHKNC